MEKTKDTSSIPDHVDSGGETPALPVEIRIKEAILKNGRITVDESITTPGQRIVRHFSNIEFHASNLIPGKDINFKLSLRDAIKPGLGSLSV